MWGNAEAMDCLSSKTTCPLESTVLEGWNNEKAPHSVGKQLHLCHQTSTSVWLE